MNHCNICFNEFKTFIICIHRSKSLVDPPMKFLEPGSFMDDDRINPNGNLYKIYWEFKTEYSVEQLIGNSFVVEAGIVRDRYCCKIKPFNK